MEPAAGCNVLRLLRRFVHHILRFVFAFPVLHILLRHRRRLLSPIVLKDFLLTLSFHRHGLLPVSVPIAGASLHFWIPSARRRSPSRSALLLVHGFGGDAKWQWERQIGPLSRAFDLYVPDLVFFGRSESDGPDRSLRFQSRCLAEAMGRLGVERYSVVGISYGGFVAFLLAEEAGEAVERVVILTAGIAATADQRAEMLAREERDVSEILLPRRPEDLMALLRRSMYRPHKWVPLFLLEDFIELMYTDRRKERVELLNELLQKGADVNPLPVLNQETLILWGDQDTVFPILLGHQLQRHLGKKSRLEVIKDAGHALQLEKPDLVNHFIKSFLLELSDRNQPNI